MNLPQYVLVTPARNEADFIERTIQSVVKQTVLPTKWVIVSDGSTDGTDEIVSAYVAEHPWIELLRMPERQERHFAGKARAFNAGLVAVGTVDYEIVGNLDADITFAPEYIEFLLKRFAENPRLGVAGTPFSEDGHGYNYRFTSIEHVSGACQLFRRACFEEIGGYIPLKSGGVDLVAVLTARMKGWQTRSFLEKRCDHHRKMGTATRSVLMVAFRGGWGDYVLGMHPLWEFIRTFYQISKPPFVLNGGLRLMGFTWAMVSRAEKVVPEELVRFRRAEQLRRLSVAIKGALTPQGSKPAAM